MTHLRIENQNSNTEIVSAAIILKLYETALSVDGNVSLKGNLLAEHARQTAYNYLTGNLPDSNTKRFPELSINVTDGLYINFADPEVERILLANNIGDGVGITMEDAAACTGALGRIFEGSTITSFDELAYFGWNKLYYNNASGELGSFYNCTNLTSIDLNGITSHNNARKSFKNCTSLTTVKNLNLTFIPRTFFSGCSSLLNIDFSNVEYFEEYACYGCTSLVSANTSNCKTFELVAFNGCTSLTTVDLSSATSMAYLTFYGCSSLVNVTWPLQSFTIASLVFLGTALTSANLTNCTSIGNGSFKNVTTLASVTWPTSSFVIGGADNSGAFAGCTALTSADLTYCTSIGVLAFRNCTSLTSVDLSNVTSIGNNAFDGCTSLSSVDLSSVTDFGSQAFNGCTALTSISLPNVTTLSPTAFRQNTNLLYVTLGPGVTSLTSNTFYKASGLKSIDLTNIVTIGDYNLLTSNPAGTFTDCTHLTTITGIGNIKTLGTYAFRSAEALDLTQVYYFLSIEKVGTYSLSNSSMKLIVFGTSLTEIKTSPSYNLNTNIKTFVLLGTTPPNIASGDYSMINAHSWYVTNLSDYQADSNWSNVTNLHDINDLSSSYKTKLQDAGIYNFNV